MISPDYGDRTEKTSHHSRTPLPTSLVDSSFYLPSPELVHIAPSKGEKNFNIDHRTSHATSVLGKISDYFERNPKVVVGLKVMGVALVVGGLIAASVFSFGAAVPLIAALGAGSSTAAVTGAFALLGTAIGLALSSIWTVFAAKITDMHNITSNNLADFVTFLALSLGGSAVITGVFALIGTSFGANGILAAQAGLGTFGTLAVFGTGGAFVKYLLSK